MTLIDLDPQLEAVKQALDRATPSGRVALHKAKMEALRSSFAPRTALQKLPHASISSSKALPGINAQTRWVLPVLSTRGTSQEHTISLAFLEVDYRRLSPQRIMAALREKKVP